MAISSLWTSVWPTTFSNPRRRNASAGGNGGTAFTFDVAYNTAPWTLSNSNYRATHDLTTNQAQVKTTVSKSTGKRYLEFVRINNGAALQMGFATAAFVTSSLANTGSITYNGVDGSVQSGAATNGTAATDADGDVVCIAIDLDNAKIWVRINGGNWNNSGTANPATSTGGFTYTGISGAAVFPTIAVNGAGISNGPVCDLQDGVTTAFSQTAPAGFSVWTA
jgi:hypothetical protein